VDFPKKATRIPGGKIQWRKHSMHDNNCTTLFARLSLRVLAFCAVLIVAAASASGATTETVLYNFTGGADGRNPAGSLIADSAGNLYGTTGLGGAYNWGVVFKLSPSGTAVPPCGSAFCVLYSFPGGADGANPSAGLIADSAGNLYGTTEYGAYNGILPSGWGVVFKLSGTGFKRRIKK
jgi:uncharacterized repeat protein (TIGR03803 family)